MKKLFVISIVGLLWSTLLAIPASAQATKQSSNVYAFADPMNAVGTAQLVRNSNGVTMNIKTEGLDAGAAYTVWWVVFNNPDACVDGCDAADVSNPDVMATVLFAAGHVIGQNGKGNFAGHLSNGDTSGDSFPLDLPGDAVGLVYPETAEIHLVVRTHGPPIPGMVDEQISTFNGGGCSDPGNEADACVDQQFAVFLPQ